MLLSAVSVLVVAQSSSEFPEGLMNNPVLFCPWTIIGKLVLELYFGYYERLLYLKCINKYVRKKNIDSL